MQESAILKTRIQQLNNYVQSLKNQVGPLNPAIENALNTLTSVTEYHKLTTGSQEQTKQRLSSNQLKQQTIKQDYISQQHSLKNNISSISLKLNTKKSKLGLQNRHSTKKIAHRLKEMDTLNPCQIEMFVTQLNIVSKIQEFYYQLINNDGQSQYFRKYLIYLKRQSSHGNHNRKLSDQSNINKHHDLLFNQSTSGKNSTVQLIFIEKQSLEQRKVVMKNIQRQSVQRYKNVLFFQAYSQKTKGITKYAIRFQQTNQIQLWRSFLNQTANISQFQQRETNKTEDLAKKWFDTGVSVRGIYQRDIKQQKNTTKQKNSDQNHKVDMEDSFLLRKKHNAKMNIDDNNKLKPKNPQKTQKVKNQIQNLTINKESQAILSPKKQSYTQTKPIIVKQTQQNIKKQISSPLINNSKIKEKLSQKQRLLQKSILNKETVFWQEQIKNSVSSPHQFQLITNQAQSRKNSSATMKSAEKVNRIQYVRPPKLSINTQYPKQKQYQKNTKKTRINSQSKEDSKSSYKSNTNSDEPLSDKKPILKRVYTRQQNYITRENSFNTTKEQNSQSEVSKYPSKKKRTQKGQFRKQLRIIAENQGQMIRKNSTARRSKGQSVYSKKQSDTLSKHVMTHRKSQIGPSIVGDINGQKFEQDSDQSQTSWLSSSDQEEQYKLTVQQLKNGIVLWKYSSKSWSPHQKRLYLSRNQLQLCYCDIKNALDQKKFFISDIKEIAYGVFDKGIISHRKANIDKQRCLTIKYTQKQDSDKVKTIEFMLSDTEPIYNLTSFCDKIKQFIKDKEAENNI